MKIRIQDLELRKLEFELQFQPGEIDFGSEVRQVGPLRNRGARRADSGAPRRAASVDDIRLVGKLDGRISLCCARCLETVEIPLSRSFDLLYRPLESERGADEVAIHEADTEIGFYSGDGMELEDSLREQVLLAVPIKAAVPGAIARACARYAAQTAISRLCGCRPAQADPRWAALGDLKNKLQ